MGTKPKWTVLVYMVADTGDSFYHDGMDDITEMMAAQFDDRIRVIVHADAPSPWIAKCWEVTGATNGKPGKARQLKNGCDHKGVLGFVQQSLNSYESDYYLLVLWGHGEGIDWKEKVLAGHPPSATIEGAGKRFAPGSQGAIEVGELGKVLAGLKLGGLKSENIVVGFDACLMGMVEVFDEIHPYVGWVVAADDEIPDTGWPYTDILQLLGERPETQPKELAEGVVDKCAKWYSDPIHTPDAKVSFAACNLSNSRAVLEAMKTLASELTSNIAEPAVRKAVKEARDFAEDLRERAYVDLYAFCSELALRIKQKTEFRQLIAAANSVMEVLGDFVIRYQFSDSYPYRYARDARAVSICFPESDDLAGSVPGIRVNWGSYTVLAFSRTTHWPDFLIKYWGREPVQAHPSKLKARGTAAG
jgi:hypothetical protein